MNKVFVKRMRYDKKQIKLIDEDVLSSTKKYGVGHSFCHHGEILQGVFYNDYYKDYVYGLTTFKCNLFYSQAIFVKDENSNKIEIIPSGKYKAKKAARKVLEFCDISVGGKIEIQSNIIPKLGFGSSTADVLSTIRAVTNMIGVDLEEEVLAKLAVDSEQASDSLMFKNEVLFAQRKGMILDVYNNTLPPYIALGFNYDANDNGFDTLSMNPLKYSRKECIEFEELRNLLFRAIDSQDISLVGEVSTRSALINQKYYPKSNLDKIIKIYKKYGAVGIQVSHSGSLVGIIWESDCCRVFDKIEEVKEELKSININSTWIFNYDI